MDIELVKESSKKAEAETTQESSSKRAGEALEQESSKKQKMDDDKETEELKRCMEIISDNGDDVTIEAIPLSTKSPSIIDWKIVKEGTISYYQIIRGDGSSRRYSTFIRMLRSFDREDLETLWKFCEHHVEDAGRIVMIKRLLDDLRVTAAKLVLLVQKLLLLVLKVNAAGIKVTTAERLQLLKG
ncbi:hypothetical protein Tco_0273660 [Tanacetum coccineum]